MKKIIIVLLGATVVFSSCRRASSVNDLNQAFLDSLVEKPLSDIGYVLSVPAGYSITETRGEDFSVFYFDRSDSTIASAFSGGVYFGNHPGSFPPANDSCKVESLSSVILGTNATWTKHKCSEEYSIQTIVASDSDEGWNAKVHAFGHAKSETGIAKVLAIYRTLRKK